MTPEEIGHLIRKTRKAQGLRQPVELERGKPTAQIGKVLDVLSALGCSMTITTPEDRR